MTTPQRLRFFTRSLPAALALGLIAAPLSAQLELELLSTGLGGAILERDSDEASLSADGRWLVFASRATGLTGSTNGHIDIYRKDMLTGDILLVSQSALGAPSDHPSYNPRVSNAGLVVFRSRASTLDPLDTALDQDMFVSDPGSGFIGLLDLDSLGAHPAGESSGAPAITPDQRFIAWTTAKPLLPADTNGTSDIYLLDSNLGTLEIVSLVLGGGISLSGSYDPALSDDGRFVAFSSYAEDLVAGDTNGVEDVFVRDRLTGTTERVSVSSAGAPNDQETYEPHMSSDGRFVVFGGSGVLTPTPEGSAGRLVYRHDRQTGETILISVDDAGRGPNHGADEATVSDDGNRVAFTCWATNWWNSSLFDYDQVYVRDVAAGTTSMVSRTAPGFTLESESDTPRISRDGATVLFADELSYLPEDTNDDLDVYRGPGAPLSDWTYLGGELTGDTWPQLNSRGFFVADAPAMVDVRHAAPLASVGVVLGLSRIDAPFKAGRLIPNPDKILFGMTDADGAWVLPLTYPSSVVGGIEIFLQAAVQDAGAPAGWALSNGVRGLSR